MTRIDVHHHAIPAFYKQWLVDQGVTAAGLAIPDWSVDQAVQVMDRHRIDTAILSVSTPGIHLNDDAQARAMARRVNTAVAEIVKDDPVRFGHFASLPLPDVEGSLAEIAYIFDDLNADGVILLANTHGTYVGDPLTEPVLDELNRRRAIVFLHPSSLPATPVPGVPPYMCDFLLDTVRAAVNLIRRGCLRRYPDIRFILAHAGGFLPYAAHRIAFTNGLDGTDSTPTDVLKDLRSFYFDIAQSSSKTALAALLTFTTADKIVFGTDFPHVTGAGVDFFTNLFDTLELPAADISAISRGTATGLLTRLQSRPAAATR